MPETAITPKSSSSLSASTSSREDTNQFFNEKKLSRCIQRKFLTYSQLAVKCHRPGRQYRPPRTSFKLTGLYHTTINRSPAINTATSCPDNSPCPILGISRIGAPCKKSLSMIDLTPLAMENENGDVRSDSSSTGERGIEEHEKVKEDLGVSVGIKKWIDGFAAFTEPEESSRFFQRPDKAASVICRVLMLNAWRRRRDEVQYLHGTIYDLNQQIEHLYLQIIVLRRLLDTENNRISKLTAEAHRAKIQFDEAVKGNNTLKSEKEKMQEEMKRLTELAEERLVAAENLRNELLSAENQLHGLDEQMSKEREKLLKLREDKRILLEKVTASEALATERGARADKAESIVEELQLKLATQIALVESSQEQIERYSKELRIKEEEKNKLMERLKSTENTGRILNLRAVSLEAQLIDRNMTLQRIEAAFNSQLSELNELKDRLIRQSQEVGWSSRMLQIAGTVVRAPRALLRTLLSGPMLTS